MLLFRLLVLLGLISAAVSFALNVGTGNPRYKQLGWKILKWTLLAAALFFAVLILERL